jgi:hypothetical protein
MEKREPNCVCKKARKGLLASRQGRNAGFRKTEGSGEYVGRERDDGGPSKKAERLRKKGRQRDHSGTRWVEDFGDMRYRIFMMKVCLILCCIHTHTHTHTHCPAPITPNLQEKSLAATLCWGGMEGKRPCPVW